MGEKGGECAPHVPIGAPLAVRETEDRPPLVSPYNPPPPNMSARPLSILSLTASLWLLAPVAAQDILILKTADNDIAEQALDTFEGDALPELERGKHFVLTVGKDGKLTVTTAEGEVGLLQARARPALLAEHYAEQIDEVRQQAGMMAGAVAGQMGMPPQELNSFLADVLAFPAQLDTLNVDVVGSPKNGFDVTLALGPAEKGWFAGYVQAIKPNPLGAPELEAKDALLTFSLNCDGGLLSKSIRPFLAFAVGAAATDKEERNKFAGLMEQMVGLMDGTMAAVLEREGGGVRSLGGLVDAAKAVTLMDSPDYKKFVKAAAEANPMADIEVTERALVHRDVAFTKQVVETGAETPMSPDGITTSFTAIAGGFQINGSDEASAKAMADMILDEKVKRAQLPNGAVLTLSLRLAELIEGMTGGMAQVGGDMPQTAKVAVAQAGGKLEITVKLGF